MDSNFKLFLMCMAYILMIAYYLPKVFPHPIFHQSIVGNSWNRLIRLFRVLTPKQHMLGTTDAVPASLAYLLRHERITILMISIGLNAIGMAIARAFPTFLYLDMTGTAISSFLLGPWWGAIAACLSSSIVNYTVFPETDTVSWTMVNITGAFFWGYIASLKWFRESRTATGPRSANWKTLFVGGVVCAGITAIPGTIAQLAMFAKYKQSLSFDPSIASAIDGAYAAALHLFSPSGLAGSAEKDLAQWAAMYTVNFVRYIPDKVFCTMIALMLIKLIFPMYWEMLVVDRPEGKRTFLLPRQPILFALIFLICGSIHVLRHTGGTPRSAPALSGASIAYIAMWIFPVIFAALAVLISDRWKAVRSAEILQAVKRAKVYRMSEARCQIDIKDLVDYSGVLTILLIIVFLITGMGIVMRLYLPGTEGWQPVRTVFRGVTSICFAYWVLMKIAEITVLQRAVVPVPKDMKDAAQLYAESLLRPGSP